MRCTLKLVLLCAYVLVPSASVFLLGFGGFDRFVSVLFQVFILSLILLFLHGTVLIVRCIRARTRSERAPPLRRLAVLGVMFLSLALLALVFPRHLRQLGATSRLYLKGYEFRYELLSDVEKLTSTHADGVTFYSHEQMLESFRQLGGESVRVQGGVHAHVNIQTGGRPYGTGWIIVPSGSLHEASEIRVTEGIYRY